MKESILWSLKMAAKRDSEMGNNLNRRVVGEKKDVVTKGDIEIGDLITKILLTTKDRITVESEEHGKQTNLLPGEDERFYVAIDDIDGTNNLRVGRGFLPYCSMIVAFDASTKKEDGYRYSDYSHAACLDYSSGKIFYTEKGLGKVEVYDMELNKVTDSTENVQDNTNLALTLSTDLVSTFRGGLLGYEESKSSTPISILPGELDATYRIYAIADSACSVFEYAMVGMGIRNGYVSSGKKQHELPLLYAFSKETGKEMVDFDGVPYDDKVYDFKGGNAQVIAADSNVVEKVMLAIKAQRHAIEKVKDSIRSSNAKDSASVRKIQEINGQKNAHEEPGE